MLMMAHIRKTITLAGVCILAGCAVATPPALTVSSASVHRPVTQINLLDPDDDQAQRKQFHAAVAQELQENDIVLSSDADSVGDLSISSAPASVGVLVSDANQPDSSATAIASTRKSRWYDKCPSMRIQASLAIYDQGDGSLLGNSKAETMICEGGTVPYEELAQLLVADLLAD